MSLYVFHQGAGNNGQLWYTKLDGSTWAPDVQVPNVAMSASPAPVIFNNRLYVFHQGSGNSGWPWYTSFDRSTWAPEAQVPNVGMSGTPGVVVYNGRLYMFHQGWGNDGNLWYTSTADGSTWAADVQVPNVRMWSSPCPVVFNNKLHVFHQGYQANGVWCCIFDGQSWAADVRVRDYYTWESPSAVVSGTELYLHWQNGGPVGFNASLGPCFTTSYKRFSGGAWTSDTLVENVKLQGAPSAVLMNNKPWVFHQGVDALLWYFIPGVAPDVRVNKITLSDSPAPIVF